MDQRLPEGVWSELTALSSFARTREIDDGSTTDECLHMPTDLCDHRAYRCVECCPHDS